MDVKSYNKMKIKDIITEGNNTDLNNDGIPDSQQTATPGLRSHRNLNNSDPYHPWRFAALFLGGAGDKSGEYDHEPAKDGPNGQSLVAAAYSEGERAILDQAAKAFGAEAKHLQLTPDGSTEVKDVNKASPIRQVGAIQRKSK
jgi:hypothetical protein